MENFSPSLVKLKSISTDQLVVVRGKVRTVTDGVVTVGGIDEDGVLVESVLGIVCVVTLLEPTIEEVMAVTEDVVVVTVVERLIVKVCILVAGGILSDREHIVKLGPLRLPKLTVGSVLIGDEIKSVPTLGKAFAPLSVVGDVEEQALLT